MSCVPLKNNIFVNLVITLHCNQRCPNCCCGIQNIGPKRHFAIDYFEHAARYLKHVDTIKITGGEPTLHPDFQILSGAFKTLFSCRQLILETNGCNLNIFPECLTHYDLITITRYGPDTYKGCVDNLEQINAIKDHFKNEPDILARIIVKKDGSPIVHKARSSRGSGKPCGRTKFLSYANGLLYPCCVAWGMAGGIGIPLDDKWIERIKGVKPPCKDCLFSPASSKLTLRQCKLWRNSGRRYALLDLLQPLRRHR